MASYEHGAPIGDRPAADDQSEYDYVSDDDIWQASRNLKTAFNPDWLLTPGQVCGDISMTENLRFDSEYEFDAELNWDNESGFQGMAELCHGCGGCRTSQDTGGVMCPTYRAADEEITSTRGRANMLR